MSLLELTTYPHFHLQGFFSAGFFNIGSDQIGVSRQGWIFLAFTFPLTVVVLGMSYAWIRWTGVKVERPSDYSAPQAIALAAHAMRLGAGRRKDGV